MKHSNLELVKKTLPFIIARLGIYAAFAGIALVVIGVLIGIGTLLIKLFGDSSGVFLIIILITAGSVWGGFKLLERYILGLLKTAHVAVIVELLANGELPDGKGQIEYGKNQVTKNFGTTRVC